jgi:glycosyltransferase involved in cell wall biosynthesis
MLVSVVMPMRNAAPFVRSAVLSVLAESVIPLELLVIDDGSVDGSAAIVTALTDPRVRLLRGPQRGIAACLNVGLLQAKGNIVMRCDADDIYPTGRIARQVTLLQSNPDAVAVCGGFLMMDEGGTTVMQSFTESAHQNNLNISSELQAGTLRTSLCTFAFRRNVLKTINGFREYFETAEDIDFALRLGGVGPVYFFNENFYNYRIHGSSITHSKSSERRIFFDEMAKLFAQQRTKTGSDDLMNSIALSPPASDKKPHSAEQHLLALMVVGSWQCYRKGNYRGALKQAWRAVGAYPQRLDAWRLLVIVFLKIGIQLVLRKINN